jgi:hypothetical protein
VGSFAKNIPFLMGNFDEWKQLADLISADELKRRCEAYWNIVMTISGLTAGFSYLVTTGTAVNFLRSDLGYGIDRNNLFGFLTIMAFLFSICATILAASLQGYMNLSGSRYACGFVKKFWFIIDIPIACIMIGLLFMFISGMIFIGGVYSNWVWYASFGSGIILLSLTGIIFLAVRVSVHKNIDKEYAQNKSQNMPELNSE